MQYVTYSDMFTFALLIIGLIGLMIEIYKAKK